MLNKQDRYALESSLSLFRAGLIEPCVIARNLSAMIKRTRSGNVDFEMKQGLSVEDYQQITNHPNFIL